MTCAAVAARVGSVVVGLVLASSSPVLGQSESQPLPSEQVVACGPRLAAFGPPPAEHLVGAPDNPVKRLFRQGETVLLNVGTASDVAVGTQFFLRRQVSVTDLDVRALGFQVELTTGWVRTVTVEEHASLAVIERTCADVHRDDYLAPFQWPAPVTAMAAGAVSYDESATVLFGPDGRALSAPGQQFVMDQGTDHGLALGQRVTVFRQDAVGPVIDLGEGVTVFAEETWATVHLTSASAPVHAGDRVAIQRP